MKRARDVRDQLVGLMERVELEMETAPEDHDAIKKVTDGGSPAMRLSVILGSLACAGRAAGV